MTKIKGIIDYTHFAQDGCRLYLKLYKKKGLLKKEQYATMLIKLNHAGIMNLGKELLKKEKLTLEEIKHHLKKGTKWVFSIKA